MGAALTSDTFAKLLDFLDADRERAGEEYEGLRCTLIRFFEWRSAPFPEEHADEVFNRVAKKLGDGVEVRSMSSYCYEVARLVFLEAVKGHDSKRSQMDSIEVEVEVEADVADSIDETTEKELRLACLDDCLRALPRASADLILEYYRYEKRAQIGQRRALAERFGLRRDALANRAQRLRDKLEQCVSGCLKKGSAI
jgi:DNA-directed RNA polymerase specialized sigma24 family protein